jgi:hypothetical protein
VLRDLLIEEGDLVERIGNVAHHGKDERHRLGIARLGLTVAIAIAVTVTITIAIAIAIAVAIAIAITIAIAVAIAVAVAITVAIAVAISEIGDITGRVVALSVASLVGRTTSDRAPKNDVEPPASSHEPLSRARVTAR